MIKNGVELNSDGHQIIRENVSEFFSFLRFGDRQLTNFLTSPPLNSIDALSWKIPQLHRLGYSDSQAIENIQDREMTSNILLKCLVACSPWTTRSLHPVQNIDFSSISLHMISLIP
jgi:hypothetical protein